MTDWDPRLLDSIRRVHGGRDTCDEAGRPLSTYICTYHEGYLDALDGWTWTAGQVTSCGTEGCEFCPCPVLPENVNAGFPCASTGKPMRPTSHPAEAAVASTWLWMQGRKEPPTMRDLARLFIDDLRRQGYVIVPCPDHGVGYEGIHGIGCAHA